MTGPPPRSVEVECLCPDAPADLLDPAEHDPSCEIHDHVNPGTGEFQQNLTVTVTRRRNE